MTTPEPSAEEARALRIAKRQAVIDELVAAVRAAQERPEPITEPIPVLPRNTGSEQFDPDDVPSWLG